MAISSQKRPYLDAHLNSIFPTKEPEEPLLRNGYKEIPKDHWCRGCEWAKNLLDRFMCPFIEGSCVKIPMSIQHPDPQFFQEELEYDRLYKAAKAKKR